MNSADGSTKRDKLYCEAVSAYGAALARLVVGYEMDPEKRRDLLQEIQIELWKSFGSFDERCSMRTWVYRVGHNVAVNHVVKHKRYRRTTLVGLDQIENMADQTNAVADVETQDALARLQALIQRLKAPDRQIVLLYLEDLDANSIAQITGLSARNVATKIHRIKQILARRFHEEDDHG